MDRLADVRLAAAICQLDVEVADIRVRSQAMLAQGYLGTDWATPDAA